MLSGYQLTPNPGWTFCTGPKSAPHLGKWADGLLIDMGRAWAKDRRNKKEGEGSGRIASTMLPPNTWDDVRTPTFYDRRGPSAVSHGLLLLEIGRRLSREVRRAPIKSRGGSCSPPPRLEHTLQLLQH
jgi:hypothetical protein